jgi:hypothetical protein
MQAVRRLQGSRTVATFFAENDPKHYRVLDTVVSEYAAAGRRKPGSSGLVTTRPRPA